MTQRKIKNTNYPTHVIVSIDAAMDLLLAAQYANKVLFSAANGDWVKDPIRREMCAMASGNIVKAIDAWRKDRGHISK